MCIFFFNNQVLLSAEGTGQILVRTACKERMSAPTGFMSSSSPMPVGMSFPYSTKWACASMYMMRAF